MSTLRRAAARTTASLCPRCHDRRFITEAGQQFAVARRCPACAGACAECGGVGVLHERDWTGSWVARPCACADLDHRIGLYNASATPRRYAENADSAIDHFDDSGSTSLREAKLAFLRLWRDFVPGRPGIGLSGPVGTGKTHLVAGLIGMLTLKRGVPCRFVEFTHLLSDIRRGYDAGKGEQEIIGHLVEVPVLVIDELGKGLQTEWQLAILDELISRRYNQAVSTFFTTNFPLVAAAGRGSTRTREKFDVQTLEERIGTRMYSRLSEMCTMLTIEGPDWRRTRVSADRAP